MKMVSMRPAKAMADDKDTMPGRPDGVPVMLSHDHVMKLGGPMAHGTKIDMSGQGEVTDVSTHEVDGEPRHSMTITMQRVGVEPKDTPADRREELRGDIERAAAKA